MRLFGKLRTTKWAAIVFPDGDEKTVYSEEELYEATTVYIRKHAQIIYDQIPIVLKTKDKEKQKESFKLAERNMGPLGRVRKYANKYQRVGKDQAIKDFFIMEDRYKHPNKEVNMAKLKARKQNKNEFWEGYGMVEMVDIFSGKKK